MELKNVSSDWQSQITWIVISSLNYNRDAKVRGDLSEDIYLFIYFGVITNREGPLHYANN